MNAKQIIVSLAVIVAIVGTLAWVRAQTSGIRIDPTCQATSVTVFTSANPHRDYSNYRAVIKAGDCTKVIEGRIETTINVLANVEADIRARAPNIYVSMDGLNSTEVQYRGRFGL